MSVPTYAYAYNNPLRYTDRTGLFGEGVAEFPWWSAAPVVPFLPEIGAGAAVLGAVGAVGALGYGASYFTGQFPDPGAGIPFPITPPIRVPYAPSEPGCGSTTRAWAPDRVPFPEIPSPRNCDLYWGDVLDACVDAEPWNVSGCIEIANAAKLRCISQVN